MTKNTKPSAFETFVFGKFQNPKIELAVKFILSLYDRDALEDVYASIKNETSEKEVASILRDEINEFIIDNGGHDEYSRHVMAILATVWIVKN